MHVCVCVCVCVYVCVVMRWLDPPYIHSIPDDLQCESALVHHVRQSPPGVEYRLQVGNVGITDVEARSHFALWCFLAAPLLIGTDLHTASAEAIKILSSKELIAIDQVSGEASVRLLSGKLL